MGTVFYKISAAASCCFLFVCFNSCNGQPKIDDCKMNYKNANNNLNAYYQNNEEALLLKALDYTEKAMQCTETRRQAVEKKISLLALLKDHKAGYKFVDSLNENDFAKKYKKAMHYNLFKAFEYESKGDTSSAYKLYTETIKDISNYLQLESNTQKALEQEVYYDLFFVKSRILSQKQIDDDLDKLAKEYPSDKDFFMTLKSSFFETSKAVNPIRN